MILMYQDYYLSFIGLIKIEADDNFLTKISVCEKIGPVLSNEITHYTKRWFDSYFQKKPIIAPPLQPAATYFSQKVRAQTLKIPFGECRTYSDIAKKIARPKAYRAVAQALKHNPFMIIVPCHRVISKKGIGGYNGGIEIKKRLLEFEGCESINL